MDTKEFGKMLKRILILEGSCQECERIENRKAKKRHSGELFVDLLSQNNLLLPDDFAEYIYHIGNGYEVHSIVQIVLIPSKPRTRKTFNLIAEKLNTIWTNPESHRSNTRGELITIPCIGAV